MGPCRRRLARRRSAAAQALAARRGGPLPLVRRPVHARGGELRAGGSSPTPRSSTSSASRGRRAHTRRSTRRRRPPTPPGTARPRRRRWRRGSRRLRRSRGSRRCRGAGVESCSRRDGTRSPKPEPEPEPEPAPPKRTWLDDLEDRDKAVARTARRMIDALEKEGIDDAESLVRRDVLGNEPIVATRLLARDVLAAIAKLDDRDADGGRGSRRRRARVVEAARRTSPAGDWSNATARQARTEDSASRPTTCAMPARSGRPVAEPGPVPIAAGPGRARLARVARCRVRVDLHHTQPRRIPRLCDTHGRAGHRAAADARGIVRRCPAVWPAGRRRRGDRRRRRRARSCS